MSRIISVVAAISIAVWTSVIVAPSASAVNFICTLHAGAVKNYQLAPAPTVKHPNRRVPLGIYGTGAQACTGDYGAQCLQVGIEIRGSRKPWYEGGGYRWSTPFFMGEHHCTTGPILPRPASSPVRQPGEGKSNVALCKASSWHVYRSAVIGSGGGEEEDLGGEPYGMWCRVWEKGQKPVQ